VGGLPLLVCGCATAFTAVTFAFELLLSPIDGVEVIVGESAPLLLDAAFELLPVSFDSIPVHDALHLSSCHFPFDLAGRIARN
jgi:hypothetical protein